MNKYFFKALFGISILIILTSVNLNSNLIQTNSFKDDLVTGNFTQISKNIDELLQKASLIHPVFSNYQSQINANLNSLLKKWEHFLVFTSKNKLLLPSQDIYKINPIYTSFVKEINQDINSLTQDIQSIQAIILNPQFKFQENYLVNSNLYEGLDHLNYKVLKLKLHLDLVEALIGNKSQSNILVLLQNDYEFRATGGFISAVLDIELFKGQIKKLEVLDIYDLDGQLVPDLDSPLEFSNLNPKLFIRDSNFHPDFNKTALLIDRQIQKAISKSYDFIASVNLSFLNQIIESPIELKYKYTFLDKLKLKNEIKEHIIVLLEKVLDSKQILSDSFRSRDLQITAKDPNLDRVLSQNNFYHDLDLNLTTISKANVNGYKSFFPQDSTIQIIADHSKEKVKKTIKISSKHPYSNQNQIYLESIFKQLNLKNSDDLFSGLKKDIHNFYRLYLPDFKSPISEAFYLGSNYILLKEDLNTKANLSNLKFEYISTKKQFDFKDQIEVLNFKHFKDIQLLVILPEGKALFSPVFEFKKIKDNTYEIPFDSEFILIDKDS